jgi:hypothetical protein
VRDRLESSDALVLEFDDARRKLLRRAAQAVDGIPEPGCRPTDMAGQVEFDLLGKEIVQEPCSKLKRHEKPPATTRVGGGAIGPSLPESVNRDRAHSTGRSSTRFRRPRQIHSCPKRPKPPRIRSNCALPLPQEVVHSDGRKPSPAFSGMPFFRCFWTVRGRRWGIPPSHPTLESSPKHIKNSLSSDRRGAILNDAA